MPILRNYPSLEAILTRTKLRIETQKNSLNSLSNRFIISSLVFIAELGYFLIQSRWDPDPYHDGFVYVQALAANLGYIPNRDFMALYGPINPVIQGAWLHLIGPSLYHLRIFTALILAITGCLIYLGTQKYYGRYFAISISLLWAIGNPFVHNPTLPWPNILLNLILISGILISRKNKFSSKLTPINLALVAFLFTLDMFIRNYALMALVMTFLAVIINSTDKIKSLGYFFAGASLAGFLSMLVITKLRMWNDFYKQTVEYALHLGADDRPLRGLINFRIIMFGLLFIFILMLFKNLKNAGAKSLKNRVLKIFMILILWISIGYSGILQQNRNWNQSLSKKFSHNLHLLIENLIYMPLYFIVFFVLLLYLLKIKNINKSENFSSFFQISIAVSSIFQLVPSPHIAKIWFIIPVIVIGLAPVFSEILPNNLEYLNLARKYIIIPIIITFLFIFYKQANIHRVDFKNNILAGMQADPKLVEVLDSTLGNIEKYVINNDVEFKCVDGIYSVASNKYLSNTNQYVINIPEFKHKSPDTKQIFFCGATKPFSDYYEATKYRVLFVNPGDEKNQYNFLIEKINQNAP